jgi:hypothetical protein
MSDKAAASESWTSGERLQHAPQEVQANLDSPGDWTALAMADGSSRDPG